MDRRRLLRSLLALSALAAIAPALADDHGGNSGRGGGDDDDFDDDHDYARDGVAAGNVLSLDKLLELVKDLVVGTIVDVRLHESSNRLQYRIKFIDLSGRVLERRFDARTGAVLD